MSTLKEEFKDREYRRAYAESLANTIIANQLRLMRGGMSQAAFADLVGMKQSRISEMEDENYGSWTTNTLKTIADKKDVVFVGKFMSFSELLDVARNMSEETLRPVPFDDDPVFRSDVDAAPPTLPTTDGSTPTPNQIEDSAAGDRGYFKWIETAVSNHVISAAGSDLPFATSKASNLENA